MTGVRLSVRGPFAAAELAAYLAARAVPGVETVAGTRVSRTVRLPCGPASVELALAEDGVEAELRLADDRDRPAAVEACRRLLDLDADPGAVDAHLGGDDLLGPLVARVPGRRSPGAVDAGEILVRAIVGQQISVAGARTILGRLAERYGEPVQSQCAELTRLFPSPERLAEADPADLPMPRARGEALRDAARALADGAVVLDRGADRDELRRRLVALRGVGRWTADYVLMRGLGDPDVLMDTDLGVRRAVRALGRSDDELRARSARWAPWRSYATHHLWGAAQLS